MCGDKNSFKKIKKITPIYIQATNGSNMKIDQEGDLEIRTDSKNGPVKRMMIFSPSHSTQSNI